MPAYHRQFVFALLLSLAAQQAHAHFPWLATDEQGHAILFFGESPAERSYHLPEAVEQAEVMHVMRAKRAPVSLTAVDTDEFIGRRASSKVGDKGRLAATIVYGIYHGSKLTYYAQHELALRGGKQGLSKKPSSASKPASGAKPGSGEKGAGHEKPALFAKLTRTAEGGVAARVMWNSQPLVGAQAQLFCDEGHVEGSAKTDADGYVRFTADEVESGLNGIMVGHTVKEAGTIDDEPYSSASHYLTVTFYQKKSESAGSHSQPAHGAKQGSGAKKASGSGSKNQSASNDQPESAFALLPKAISSFGAAASDGWLYVYSGHIGRAHAHSRDNLSQHFVRAKIDGSGDWEALPMGPPLQGLAMVPHGGKIYRIGGLQARNAKGEDDDLHSLDSFARFDPSTKQWTNMPPLPKGRSSHNAVVLDDKLYVVGGWKLAGEGDDGDWHTDALVYDLKQTNGQWRPLPSPPFLRRAFAVGHAGGRVVTLGGITDDGEISRDSFFYNPTSGEWSEGPKLPGEKSFYSFGVAAWNLNGVLFAGGMEGVLYRLDEQANKWVKAADFATPRFFHQLVPAGPNELLAVGGASPTDGHLATIERLRP